MENGNTIALHFVLTMKEQILNLVAARLEQISHIILMTLSANKVDGFTT